MAENFDAQAVTSTGAVFATDIRASDSAHFPFSKIAWGADSTEFKVTSTATPLPVTVFGGSTAVTLSGSSNAAGALTAGTYALSSLLQTVGTARIRLYGMSLSNPDSATNVWAKVYSNDSASITLGSAAAKISQMVPFGGGREMSWPTGVLMVDGMSLTASLSGQSTAHDAPATTIYATVYYEPSS